MIGKEMYGVDEMSSQQMATFLTSVFPITVTRPAINMAMLEIKGQHVATTRRGNEIAYRLVPFGREYILRIAAEIQSASSTTGQTPR
jgi:hypothetical protein